MTDITHAKPPTKRPRKMAREPNADVSAASEGVGSSSAGSPPNPSPAKPQSKSKLVLELLSRAEGATIEQLVAATGWLPHTTRAALTGLKKKGHAITNEKPADGSRVYRALAAPAGADA